MKISAHYLQNESDDYLRRLRSSLSDNLTLTSGAELPAQPDYHILIGGRFEERHLTASPNLRAVIIPWAGLPVKVRPLLFERPHLSVHNLHYNALAVAESALALMLAASRRLLPADRAFRGHDWTVRYRDPQSTLLAGRTALILGYGAIGQRIAAVCHALGMDVIATRRTPTHPSPESISIRATADLPALLPRANVLHVCLPLTDETDQLLGPDKLALLPDRAVIVNIARGPIIDEAALFTELRSGRISAGLDVWYTYPAGEEERSHTPPSRFPFHELDNVVMTPHMAEHAVESEQLHIEALAELLNTAADGRPMPNRVDPHRGY